MLFAFAVNLSVVATFSAKFFDSTCQEAADGPFACLSPTAYEQVGRHASEGLILEGLTLSGLTLSGFFEGLCVSLSPDSVRECLLRTGSVCPRCEPPMSPPEVPPGVHPDRLRRCIQGILFWRSLEVHPDRLLSASPPKGASKIASEPLSVLVRASARLWPVLSAQVNGPLPTQPPESAGLGTPCAVHDGSHHARCGVIGLENAGVALADGIGGWSLYVWAIGLLAAGQASTMVCTYAGQIIMSGCLEMELPPWKRVFVTRLLALGPALVVALLTSSSDGAFDSVNEYLNVLQSVQLPFAMLPALHFAASTPRLGRFASNGALQVVSIGLETIPCMHVLTTAPSPCYTAGRLDWAVRGRPRHQSGAHRLYRGHARAHADGGVQRRAGRSDLLWAVRSPGLGRPRGRRTPAAPAARRVLAQGAPSERGP